MESPEPLPGPASGAEHERVVEEVLRIHGFISYLRDACRGRSRLARSAVRWAGPRTFGEHGLASPLSENR